MNPSAPSLRLRQRQQTYVEIVRTAFELFARDGYDAVPVEAIAAAGVSRATFFNYFPRKEALLLEIARARSTRLKGLLEEFRASGREPSYPALVELILELNRENARIGSGARELLLKAFAAHITHGKLLPAREQAVQALAEIVATIPRRGSANPMLVAETLFAVALNTMLEWLMRKDAPQNWLIQTMRARLELVIGGVQ